MSIDWSKYLAKGVTEGPVANRKEIRDLSEVELYLFLEGLRKFQNVDVNDPLSYFQIAGIHGLPYTTWPPGDKEIPQKESGPGPFCPHTSIVFLTWHRPYLALYESALYTHVNDIAEGIDPADDKNEVYRKAAKSFRLPYWDWARKYPQKAKTVFPPQALKGYPRPQGPPSKNSHEEYYNSLAYAPFLTGVQKVREAIATRLNPDPNEGYNPKYDYDTTVRYPGKAEQLKEDVLEEAYFGDKTQFEGRNLSERVGYVLNSYSNYAWMSFNKKPETGGATKLPNGTDVTGGWGNYGSLEDIHNTIHDSVGGNDDAYLGHMSIISTSSFDPIFWLHHANIDRLFAIWQVLNQDDSVPDSWVTNYKSGSDTFISPKGSDEDQNTKLYPFRKDVNSSQPWYTSQECKWTNDFGYAYEETAGITVPTTNQAYKAAVREKVNSLYPTPAETFRAVRQKKPEALESFRPQVHMLEKLAEKRLPATHSALVEIEKTLPVAAAPVDPSKEPWALRLLELAQNNKYLEWLVNIHAEKHSLGGRYVFRAFLGPIQEEDVSLWSASPHFVGTFYPLGQDQDTACAKCRDDQASHLKITSQIPLTIALIERYLAGLLPNLEPETVVLYLREHLHWRVSLDGRALDSQAEVAGLEVSVTSNEVTIPEDDSQFPTYARDVIIYPTVTTNREQQGRGHGTGYHLSV